MLELWFAGVLVNIGICCIWHEEWRNESFLKHWLRFFLVVCSSWIGLGFVIGRIAWMTREIQKDTQKLAND